MDDRRTVTFLTDFGMTDAYVAAMKGVVVSLAPDANIVDASHDIPPQDVQAGAWVLGQYWRSYPRGTIHVAVVDPGVGTERAGLLVQADGHYFIAPDNGLLTWVLRQCEHVELRQILPEVHREQGLSKTFHGRDVFAHVAGLLADGAAPKSVSKEVDSVVMPDWAFVHNEADIVMGEVVHIDHFGNLITNIARELVMDKGWPTLAIRAGMFEQIPLRQTYGEGKNGELIALFGSSDTLEIAVPRGSAAKHTGLHRGSPVVVGLPEVRGQ